MIFDHQEKVFYSPFGKSASSFFQSLLHGHPEILMIPAIVKFHRIYRHVQDFGLDRQLTYLIDTALPHIFYRQKTKDMGDFRNFDICEETFRWHFKDSFSQHPDNLQNFIESSHYAFAKATKADLTQVKVIFVHMHRIANSRIEDINGIYPKAVWLSTVREPKSGIYSNFSSHRRFDLCHQGYSYCQLNPLVFFDYRVQITKLETLCGHQYIVVRLEDLLRNTEAIMREVARRLKITFLPCLLESTLGNSNYISTSGLNDNISGPSLTVIRPVYKNEFTENDTKFVETYTKWYMQRFGYNFESSADMSLRTMLKHNFLSKSALRQLRMIYEAWQLKLCGYTKEVDKIREKYVSKKYLNILQVAEQLHMTWAIVGLLTLKTWKISINRRKHLKKRLDKQTKAILQDPEFNSKILVSPQLIHLHPDQ